MASKKIVTKVAKKAPAKKAAVKKSLPIEVVCIIDRSGSMASIHNEVIGGLNNFIDEQKKIKGKANLTLVQFDDKYDVLQLREDLQKVKTLTLKDFVPRGMTALNDAIGKTVNEFVKLKNDKKIDKAIFCIMTDGGENASKEFTDKAALKKLTEQVQKDNKWEFVFLAANQDAFTEGSKYGFSNTSNFVASAGGTLGATHTMSVNTVRYRNSNS